MILKYSHTWKVAEKGFKMAFMMSKLAMIYSTEIILEKKIAKNHCEIQVRTMLVCALYSIKYGNLGLITFTDFNLQFKILILI